MRLLHYIPNRESFFLCLFPLNPLAFHPQNLYYHDMKKDIDIEKLKKEIVERLKPLNPDKIILFGSYAHGNPDEDSDIDLYVVTNDDFIPMNWREKSDITLKISKRLRCLRKKHAIDLIVHTRKMSEKFTQYNSSFANEILTKGKILYEKEHSRRLA